MGYEGLVLLRVRVGADGRVAELQVKESSGYDCLDDAASAAVRKWTFIPAMTGSTAIESTVEIPIRFRLEPKNDR